MKIRYIIFFIFLTNSITNCNQVSVIAHRGASNMAPENTLSAFKKAIELNADYFELDVRTSKDDSLIIMHDETVNRTTNDTGKVNNLTFSDLKKMDAGFWFNIRFINERIPTLFEALSLVKNTKSNIGICVHINESKDYVVSLVVNLIKKMQMEEQVIISSFEYNRLAFSKQIAPEIKTLWLLPDYLNQELIKKASEININILGVRPEDNVAKEMINASHIMNMNVWKWTVDDITEMRNFINLGIDGIITDNPQLLMSISRLQERNANLYMYVLNQNYPNPFNNETVITYYLSDKCFYRIVL
jgi:glycerophosphoryl diester phosphodiesterase